MNTHEQYYKKMNQTAFVLMHIIPFSAFWIPVAPAAWFVCAGLYILRMFAITAGYHRYFSHKAFRTSRAFQFILAFLAQSSGQKGVLWWASHHRVHHQKSDSPEDVHSPKQKGFWYAHMGWWFGPEYNRTRTELIEDFACYPELRWLNRYFLVPPILLGALCLALWGLDGLVIGFFLSTVLLYHGTFTINSLAHVWGSQTYPTRDESRNNWFLAIITMGEGWHNNHHYSPRSASQGFLWWQYDLTFYILKILEALGIVWQLRPVPQNKQKVAI